MSESQIELVHKFDAALKNCPQVLIATDHLFHAGVYARTIIIPAGTGLTGALLKVATVLIVSGDVLVYAGDETFDIKGYRVLAGSAGRKCAFVARQDTVLTMIFATNAKSVAEAEDEFTDEAPLLFSRREDAINNTIITGE